MAIRLRPTWLSSNWLGKLTTPFIKVLTFSNTSKVRGVTINNCFLIGSIPLTYPKKKDYVNNFFISSNYCEVI